MFERSLSDLVSGIRAHKDNEAQFISGALKEIKQELQSTIPEIKSQAVSKLTYVSSLFHATPHAPTLSPIRSFTYTASFSMFAVSVVYDGVRYELGGFPHCGGHESAVIWRQAHRLSRR